MVADIDLVLDLLNVAGNPLAGKPCLRLRADRAEPAEHLLQRRRVHGANEGLGELTAIVRGEVAQGTENAWCGGDDDREAAEQLPQLVGVQRPGAAVGDQGEVSGVVALLDGDQPESAEHVLVDDVDHASGRFVQGESHGGGERRQHRLGGIEIERHLAAGERRRQVAENGVGVGHGGLDAATAVAGRSRFGAGALGPHPQCLRIVRDLRDRPPARADAPNVDCRRADGKETDLGFPGNLRRPVDDDADVGGGTAHVEGQEVRSSDLLRDPAGAGDAARGPGEDHVNGLPDGGVRRHPAAVGAQHVDSRLGIGLPDSRLQIDEIAPDAGLDVGVHDRDHRPFILAELRQQVGGQRNRQLGNDLCADFADPELVIRIGVGVEQADRERLDSRSFELPQAVAHVLFVQVLDDITLRGHALSNPDGVFQRRQRSGLFHSDPTGERSRRPGPRQVEDVLVALGRDQADTCALAFENGVGRHGRTVHDPGHPIRIQVGLSCGLAQTRHDPCREVVGRGQGLRTEALARGGVVQERIGERSADVDSDEIGHSSPRMLDASSPAFSPCR